MLPVFATLVVAHVAFFTPPACASIDASTTTDLLWPLPTKYTFGSDVYTFTPSTFQFLGTGAGGNSDILKDAFNRYIELIFHTPVPFYPSENVSSYAGIVDSILVDVLSDNETLGPDTNETYRITLMDAGKGTITAFSVYGALRGLETFSQLVFRNIDDTYGIHQVTIVDIPRFTFRGTMIDSSRHYLSFNTIINHLETMAYSKFNILNWHITDDQSFPYESNAFPNLSLKGAYDNNHVYTVDMINDVIDHARKRGIRVIVEFDTPGHTQSWGLGQPDLLTQCYSGGKPDGFGPINPVVDSTWTFLKTFYSEVADLFPDPYLHLGGDEVSFSCWESNPVIQQWMKEHNYTDYSKVEQYYETMLLDLVAGLDKQYIVWQEIFDNGLKVLPNTVIDVWKKGWEDEMKKVTGGGLHAVLSTCWYLNYIAYGEDWTDYYKCDPQNFGGTAAEQALVIGGHACLWGEYVDSSNFLSRYWPRAAAVGERLWSAASVNDTSAASPRLHNFRCRLISRGIPAEPVLGPSFCTTEWAGLAEG